MHKMNITLRPVIRIATRKSPLALWQANAIRDRLVALWPGLRCELLPMITSGDQFLKDKLIKIGGKGLFVKELEEALLDGRADLAVHSMKDVPVSFPEGLMLAAICDRDNPFDAFVSPFFPEVNQLPIGAVVGTSSLRRQSQLLALRPDLTIKPLRGNIHTRLQKLEQGEYDAIILAAAGLERMNMPEKICEIMSPSRMLPACGQGALGIECRADDEMIQALVQPLIDPITTTCVMAERDVNEGLGGNCHTPLAVFCAPLPDSRLILRAKVASEDGQSVIAVAHEGAFIDAPRLAKQSIQALLTEGAQALLRNEV